MANHAVLDVINVLSSLVVFLMQHANFAACKTALSNAKNDADSSFLVLL
jgi:hypothetical protein